MRQTQTSWIAQETGREGLDKIILESARGSRRCIIPNHLPEQTERPRSHEGQVPKFTRKFPNSIPEAHTQLSREFPKP